MAQLLGYFYRHYLYLQGEGKTFKFPDLFPEEIADEDYKPNKDFEKVQEEYKKNTTIQEDRQHMPSWFGL